MKYVPTAVSRDLRVIGERFSQQRKLLSLTVQDVAQRAGVSATTVMNLEHGRSVRSDSLLSVARVLQLAQPIVEGVNPYRNPIGALRAAEQLPQRVRQ